MVFNSIPFSMLIVNSIFSVCASIVTKFLIKVRKALSCEFGKSISSKFVDLLTSIKLQSTMNKIDCLAMSSSNSNFAASCKVDVIYKAF